MRLGIKFWSLVLFAAMCFAPSAFGLAPITQKATPGISAINVPAIWLTFALGHEDHDHAGQWGSSSGCGAGQGGGWGWDDDHAPARDNHVLGRDDHALARDDHGWGGGEWGGNNSGCTSVPEGGMTVMYLLLAGACCFGAMALRSRRQRTVVETR